MKHRLASHHKEHLEAIGVTAKRKIKVPSQDYATHYAEWQKTLPGAGHEVWHMKALGHAAWQQHNTKQPRRWGWAALGAALVCLILFALPAHCQFSKVNSIQFQQNGSPVTGGFFTYPFSINCSSNITCAASGSVLTVAGAAGGSGTVTSFSAGNLSPLFTTSVANPTTTPALSFTLSNAAANTVYGNNTGSPAAPGFQTMVAAQEPSTTVNSVVNDTNVTGSIAAQALTLGWTGTLSKARNLATAVYSDQNNTYTAATTQTFDTAKVKYYDDAPIFYATRYAGADMCAKIAAVYADAAYTSAVRAIIDATGFAGDQNCASNALANTRPTWIKLGAVTIHATVQQTFGWPSSDRLAAPSAPTASSTTTTGGTLNNLVFVKVSAVSATLGSVPGEALSAEIQFTMNAACAGTPTCTAIPNAPASAVASYGYNVYQSTTTGTEKLCNTAPIPYGQTFTIKANCTGVTPPSNLADTDISILSGVGEMTKWSMECAACNMNVNAWSWWLKDFAIVGNRTDYSGNGMLVYFSNTIADGITFIGGNTHVFISGGRNFVLRNTKHAGLSQAGYGVFVIGSQDGLVADQTFLPATWPTASGLQAAVSVSGGSDVSVKGVKAEGLDFSQVTDGAAVVTQGAALRTNIDDVHCNVMINADCVAVLGMSLDTHISNVHAQGSNTTTGITSTLNNGDVIDLFSAGRTSLSNITGQSIGNTTARFPCFEFFDSSEISATNINCYDSTGEGAKLFGCTGCSISNSHMNRNGKSGILLVDSATVVTCNNTTTVAYVSGNGFGPWPPGTTVNIGAGPTAFQIASVASTTSLTLTAACNLGASQAFTVFTQDTQLTGNQTDDNGTAALGANTASGIDLLGSSFATISGGSANDNRATASKTQLFGINAGGAGASFSMVDFDPSANVGGTCSGEIGPAVAGNHHICDVPGKSVWSYRDGTGEIWHTSDVKRVKTDVTNATTTFATITGLTFNAAASQSYKVDCELVWQTNTLATGGLKLQLIGPAAPTNVLLTGEIWNDLIADSTAANLGASSATVTALTTAMNGKAAVRANATNYIARIHGVLENGTTAGLVSVQFAEQGAGTATIKRGSSCMFVGY